MIARSLELGYNPSTPFLEDSRYDLVLEKDGVFHRVQVKYIEWMPASSSAYYIDLTKTNHGKRSVYTEDEIDIVVVYFAKQDKICWFDKEEWSGKTALAVRSEPTKNGQVKKIIMMDDYLF